MDQRQNLANINWYPGHMAKASRAMQEKLKNIDLIIELRDARLPLASHNPMLVEMADNKPFLVILAKKDLADPKENEKWLSYLNSYERTLLIDIKHSSFKKTVISTIEDLLQEKRAKALKRGIRNKIMRVMVAGIPNVGKSTFINKMGSSSSLKTENRPGITKTVSEIKLSNNLILLDTPGILWPKIDNQDIAYKLAIIDAIGANAYDAKELVIFGLAFLINSYPSLMTDYYQVTTADPDIAFREIAYKRSYFITGNKIDELRLANSLLNEWRNRPDLKISWEKYDA